MNWSTKSLEEITVGKNTDGSSMLESFLQDYSKEFNDKSLQPSCPSCLRKYYNNYKRKFNTMKSTSNYQLEAKYEAIPLKVGSPIYLTNQNLTDEYAEQLIARYVKVHDAKGKTFDPKTMFSKLPENWEEAQIAIAEASSKEATEAATEAQEAAKAQEKAAKEAQDAADAAAKAQEEAAKAAQKKTEEEAAEAAKAQEAQEKATKEAKEAQEAEEAAAKAATEAANAAKVEEEAAKEAAEAAKAKEEEAAAAAANAENQANADAKAKEEADAKAAQEEADAKAAQEAAKAKEAQPKPDNELTFGELRAKYPDIKAASKTSFLEKLTKS